ncbi:MAG TPA: pyridoxal-dependent decarboxylase [Acidimicrobiales bacterium]|nr:pyridoxal-dependent decarboxylase [Acidimicrobiales bacterium]
MRNPMFVFDDDMAELVMAYCRKRLAMDPVSLDFGGHGGSLDAELAGLLGPEGNDPAAVLRLFTDRLARAVISCDSPRFLSFIPAAPTKAALLFDMVVSASSLNGTSWLEAAGAVVAENQVLRLLAGVAGLPAGAGGCFVAGGSAGNLSALVVARDTAAHRRGRAPRRPRIAISDEAHSSVGKALHVIGVEPLAVPADDHRLTGPGLAAALDAAAAADPAVADDLVGVVATAGTTNAGIVDDLAGVAEVAGRWDLWFHVDAAYGGAALFAPSARALFTGIDRADSFVVDPHKWLFAPFDCAALLYRDPRLAKAVHTQDAAYLDVIHRPAGASGGPASAGGGPAGGGGPAEEADAVATVDEPWNPSDYAFHLTRRARGLPLWFSLAVHGTDAYRDAVETVLDTARRSADLIRATPQVELVRDPVLSVVLFRRPGWGPADYDRWSASLLMDQIGFVTPTSWEGEVIARLAFLHPDTTVQMVEEILATMA